MRVSTFVGTLLLSKEENMYEIALYTYEQPIEKENQLIIGKRKLVPNIDCYLTLWQTKEYDREILDNDPNIIRYLILNKGETNANS